MNRNLIKLKKIINVVIFKHPKYLIYLENIKDEINNSKLNFSDALKKLIKIVLDKSMEDTYIELERQREAISEEESSKFESKGWLVIHRNYLT